MCYHKDTIQRREADGMIESERRDVQKSTAYDLLNLIGENPDKVYTTAEVREIIKAYIEGKEP